MGADPTQEEHTCCKKDADPSLTQAFFDPQPNVIFLTQKAKFGIFRGNFPNPEVADPTRNHHHYVLTANEVL